MLQWYTAGMIKAILFDLYGVLIPDVYERWLKMHNLTRTGRYQRLSEENDKNRLSQDELFKALEEESNVPYSDIADFFAVSAQVAPKTFTLLEEAREKYTLGLISNGSIRTRQKLQTLSLSQYFESITISAEVGVIKPSPEIYAIALASLGVAAHEVLYIDDNSRNIEAATALGMHITTLEALPDLLSKVA